MWQDSVLSAIFLLFCITLIPMLRAREKPPLASSISTGILLLCAAGVFATLHLWLSMTTQAIVGLQWITLAWQKWNTSREG